MANLSRNGELAQIARIEFLLRDQGTFLGFLWTLLNPIFLFATLYIVFSRNGHPETFKGYLLLGVLLWNFFSAATTVGESIIARRASYLLNSPVNPLLFIIGGISAVACTSLCEAVLGFIYLAWSSSVTASLVLHYLGGFLLTGILAVGISSLLALIRIFFVDVSHLWSMALRVGFFLTPIFYTVRSIDERYAPLLWLNPLTAAFAYARLDLVEEPGAAAAVPVVGFISLALCILGGSALRRFRYRFAECE